MLTKEQKNEIVAKFGENPNDTGSAEVQVALLTARINDLTGHFKTHGKDHASRRGLIKLVGERRRMLGYVRKKNVRRYRKLIEELNLRR